MSWLSVETVRAMVERARQRDTGSARFYRELALAVVVHAAADGQEVVEAARLVAGLMEEGRAG